MFKIRLENNDLERYRARILTACKEAHSLIFTAVEALHNNTKEEMARRHDWFGNAPANAIRDGLLRLWQVIDDESRTVRFVDVRGKDLCVTYKPGRGQYIFSSPAPRETLGDAEFAYVHPVQMGCGAPPPKGPLVHVGSGMRMYLGAAFLNDDQDPIELTGTIIHELTHKVLATVDWNVAGDAVYGPDACRNLALFSSTQALKVADCWNYYITSQIKQW